MGQSRVLRGVHLNTQTSDSSSNVVPLQEFDDSETQSPDGYVNSQGEDGSVSPPRKKTRGKNHMGVMFPFSLSYLCN